MIHFDDLVPLLTVREYFDEVLTGNLERGRGVYRTSRQAEPILMRNVRSQSFGDPYVIEDILYESGPAEDGVAEIERLHGEFKFSFHRDIHLASISFMMRSYRAQR